MDTQGVERATEQRQHSAHGPQPVAPLDDLLCHCVLLTMRFGLRFSGNGSWCESTPGGVQCQYESQTSARRRKMEYNYCLIYLMLLYYISGSAVFDPDRSATARAF